MTLAQNERNVKRKETSRIAVTAYNVVAAIFLYSTGTNRIKKLPVK